MVRLRAVFLSQQGAWAVLALLLTLGLSAPAAAQGERGVIGGTITDAQGGVLPGVSVTARNINTGFTQSNVTEADGKYRFGALPLGPYEVKAELTGFTTATVTNLVLTVNRELQQNITMGLSTLQESVTVTGQAPVVEVTKSEVSSVITQQQIEMLPVANRAAVTLALLLPGTSQDGTRPRRSNAQVGAGTLQFTTTNLADGTMNMSTKAGEPRQDFPQSAIQEFKVFTTQPPAEYGGRAGGVINVVTKSGTNSFSGEGYEFFRNKAMGRLDKFTQIAEDAGQGTSRYNRNQFGAALGGPIIMNKIHFFVAEEYTQENSSYTVNTGQPQFYGKFEGVFDQRLPNEMFLGRVDGQLTPKQSGFARWAYERQEFSCEGCGGKLANQGNTLIPRDALVMGHTWVLGQKFLNEFRFNYSEQTQYQAPQGLPYYKTFDFSPARFNGTTPTYIFPSFTWGSDMFMLTHQNIREWRDDFTISQSNHNLKLGADIQNLPLEEDVQGNPSGTWTFAQDQFFDPSNPVVMANLRGANRFQASFPGLIRRQAHHYFQYYAQDEWKVASGVTLNLGIRYERDTKVWNKDRKNDGSFYPRVLPSVNFAPRGDNNNWSPRLGLAWDVRNNGTNVVRAAYGRLFNAIMNGTPGAETVTLLQTSISINNPSYPDPYGGRSPASFASTAPPNISIVDDKMVNPYSDMYNVGYSRQLGADLAINADGVYVKSNAFNASLNINTPLQSSPGVAATPSVRPSPAWGNIAQVQSIGEQDYRALLLRLEKRFSQRHQYTVSYTLARVTDNSFGATSTGTVTDFYHQEWDNGYGNADRRHTFVTSGAYLMPGNVTLGMVWTLRSSSPFSARAGRDLNTDGAVTDFVPGTTKGIGNRDNDAMMKAVNAYRVANGLTPITLINNSNNYNRFDIRASKAIPFAGRKRVELIGQVFNLFGRNNLAGIGANFTSNALSDTFGQYTTAQARQLGEVAVRFTF
jgi:Carboxypeptidase regulatory-like domain/TonB dependent receptor-like, beta-barrel